MSDQDHRAGVKEANLVSRNLKLDKGARVSEVVLEEIDGLYGIDRVAWHAGSSTLRLAYDATHCGLDGVEAILQRHGVGFAGGWWNRFKRNYYRFVEQNVRDNATHVPHCCNKVPRR